jgi:hypothetical protein
MVDRILKQETPQNSCGKSRNGFGNPSEYDFPMVGDVRVLC